MGEEEQDAQQDCGGEERCHRPDDDRTPIPRVYVYPFPPAFENASNLWEAAGLDEQGAALYFQGRRHDYPGRGVLSAGGGHVPSLAHSPPCVCSSGHRLFISLPLPLSLILTFLSKRLSTAGISRPTVTHRRATGPFGNDHPLSETTQ